MSDLHEQLLLLGIDGQVYKNNTEMLSVCPFHEDNKPSFSINLETGNWICYSNCGGGTWMQFIERIRRKRDYAPIGELTERPPEPSEPVLKSLLQRGFTREMLRKWGVVWDAARNAMRFPVFDRGGTDTGTVWRFPTGIEPKYRYNEGFRRNENLYGSWRLTTGLEELVLVEGPLDAIWVQEAGVPAVAIFGSELSEVQADIMQSLRPKHVVFCFDNDAAGQRVTKEAAPLLRRRGCWVYRVPLPSRYNDIQDVPAAQVRNILARKELCINGTGFVHQRFQRWMRPNTHRQAWK